MTPADSTATATPAAVGHTAAGTVAATGRVAAVTVAPDTVATDSVTLTTAMIQARVDSLRPAIILTSPHPREAASPPAQTYGFSAVVLLLFMVFTGVCLRFRNNVRYVRAIVDDLVKVRLRHNAFDDTVRETSFLVMLNTLWSLSAGVIIYAVIQAYDPAADISGNPISLTAPPELYMLVCMGVAVAYSLLMACAYALVGNVFTDSTHAVMWVKGFAASQGLLSLIFFPLALLCLCYPQNIAQLLWVALGSFVIAKIIFIWKGFRIFFTQISSWVLFLYYLCSLEIVPLVITFIAALQICAFVGG